MNKFINKNVVIFTTFMLLVLSEALFFQKNGINTIANFISCFILSIGVFVTFITNIIKQKKYKFKLFLTIILFLIIFGLIVIGAFFQSTSLIAKARIIYPALILTTVMILSKNYLNSFQLIRSASYGIFAGLLLSTTLAIINNISVLEVAHESLFNYGLNGGLQYKNYFAASLLASFIGIMLYCYKNKFNYFDIVLMIIITGLIFMSASRGTYLLFASFIIILFFDFIKNKIKKLSLNKKVFITILFTILILTGIVFAIIFVLNSGTYLYRIRGVNNYLNYYKDDLFHLVLGNSEVVFRGSSDVYVDILRSTIEGYNGSFEMGFINVLIKNGILGLIGYFIAYMYMIINLVKNKKNIFLGIGILIVLLMSSFVEAYVCSIHAIFGIYCYLVITGLSTCNSKKIKEDDV